MSEIKNLDADQSASQPATTEPRSEMVREVLGPLTVLAAPFYAPDNEDCAVLLATQPNGRAILIEDSDCLRCAEYRISMLHHLSPGDVIVCAGAIRADSWRETTTSQKSWEGRYYAGGRVYQLVDGEAVDLVVELLCEIFGDGPEEQPQPTVALQ
jgi:hypothetical protein